MIRSTAKPSSSRLSYDLAVILLLLIFLGVRWFDLLHMPIFIDEATGLSRTRDSLIGFPFQGLAHAKWLPTFIWSFFRPFGPESLWIIRGVNVLFSCLTMASAIALGRFLDSRASGLLAGALFLVLPYTVFFDRQALADVTLMAFGALTLVASYRLARSDSRLSLPITGLAVAAAALSKFTGFTFFAAPLLAAWLLSRPADRRRNTIRALLSLGIAALIILTVFIIGDRYLRDYQSILDPTYTWGWLVRHSNTSVGADSIDQRLLDTANRVVTIARYFVGWPVIILALGTLARAFRARPRRRLWVWLAGILTLVPMLAATNSLPARYVAFTIMPLTVLAASTAWPLTRWLRETRLSPSITTGLTAIGLSALILSPIPRSLNLWLRPEVEPIPDYGGYQTSVFPLQGLNGVRDALMDYGDRNGLPVHLIYASTDYLTLSAYWGGHTGLLRQWEDTPDQQVEVANWLIAGDRVAYLDIVEPSGVIGEEPHGNHTELLDLFPAPDGKQYRLRAVTEPGPDMLRTMLNQVYGNPDAVAADYATLTATIHHNDLLLLHPGHQWDTLRQLAADSEPVLVPLAVGWPPDFDQTADLITRNGPRSPSARAIFFNETAGDPERRVERMLNERYFRVDEQWFGALRAVGYITSASDMHPAQQQDAVFGDLIQLEAAEVGTVSIDDRSLIVVDLRWTAIQPIAPSYKVALHVVDSNDDIVAQHDGIPMGGLAPTNTWSPGEAIIDRFAIDAPPGDWRLRLILYDAETGARLPVGDADSLIVTSVTVLD